MPIYTLVAATEEFGDIHQKVTLKEGEDGETAVISMLIAIQNNGIIARSEGDWVLIPAHQILSVRVTPPGNKAEEGIDEYNAKSKIIRFSDFVN